MTKKISAGILMYRFPNKGIEVFLVHPGGPFWSGKDRGAWSIPKGLVGHGEESLAAALRELQEETGCRPPDRFIRLTPVQLKSGKVIEAWAAEGDCDPSSVRSNNFQMEWPPKSGRYQEFPEIDRASWFRIEEAKERINQGQVPLLKELLDLQPKQPIKAKGGK